MEQVDTQDLKSCALNRRAGSIPALGTLAVLNMFKAVFFSRHTFRMLIAAGVVIEAETFVKQKLQYGVFY